MNWQLALSAGEQLLTWILHHLVIPGLITAMTARQIVSAIIRWLGTIRRQGLVVLRPRQIGWDTVGPNVRRIAIEYRARDVEWLSEHAGIPMDIMARIWAGDGTLQYRSADTYAIHVALDVPIVCLTRGDPVIDRVAA